MKYFFLAISFTFVSLSTWIWLITSDFVQPERRELQDYHLEWLKTPSSHGLKINAITCEMAKTPCLMVEPDANAGVAKRGQTVRQQLSQDGVAVPEYGKTKGILVLLHGRKGRKEDLLPVAERFAAAGFKSVLPDMPAHGDNSSAFLAYATNEHEQDFANKVLHDARRFFNDEHLKAGLWGMSMGGAFAIEAASRAPENWQALVIVASFDSLEGLIDDEITQYPVLAHKPLKIIFEQLLQYQSGFQPSESQPGIWAQTIYLPTLVAHGTDDQIIPQERGEALFSAFPGNQKKWLSIPGGTHKNILITSFPLYKAMSQWYLQHF